VPVLVIDGAPLTENVAIQIWIARHFPAAKLLPEDPMQELHAISLLAWCASGIHPFLSRINSPPRVCDLPGAEESVRRLAQQQLHGAFRADAAASQRAKIARLRAGGADRVRPGRLIC
jgi:glutathione S-transferase